MQICKIKLYFVRHLQDTFAFPKYKSISKVFINSDNLSVIIHLSILVKIIN